jgi:hypothetical protein
MRDVFRHSDFCATAANEVHREVAERRILAGRRAVTVV